MGKELWKGNEAVAEALIRSGLDFFAGYPITPSTEILEYLSYRMPELGRVFIQAENEISSINMVMGGSACGFRCLTASSGPGISLKASGYSYAARYELPFVVINVQRWGTGLGSLDSGQSDYFRDVKAGGHGDYHHIVYAPASVQELIDQAYTAFDVAERYRIGVTILSEALLGQMVENIVMPEFKTREVPLTWGIDGTGDVGLRMCGTGNEQNRKRVELYGRIEEEIQDWESFHTEDAECIFVAFGLPARSCYEAVRRLRAEGCKVGLIRPKTLWPYPYKAFEQVAQTAKQFLVVETNTMGQMVEDVALAVKKSKNPAPVYSYAYGSTLPRVSEVIAKYWDVVNHTAKERF